MRALTLHQPYASLIAIGAKRIETRSWATAYRGPIAIHAGKSRASLDRCQDPLVRGILTEAGLNPDDLPMSVVLCTATLVSCTDSETISEVLRRKGPAGDLELSLGNYEPQRFGWLLRDVEHFNPPVPAKGAQGLWEWRDA